MNTPTGQVMAQHKVLVVGIANEHSIAYGCARAFRELGAELAITYLNDKAKSYVEPLAQELGASLLLPLDVSKPGELEAVFDEIRATWGRLDVAVHSIAFAPKADLQGGLLTSSAEGFSVAMDISCHSFIRMARLAGIQQHHAAPQLALLLQLCDDVRPEGEGGGGDRGDFGCGVSAQQGKRGAEVAQRVARGVAAGQLMAQGRMDQERVQADQQRDVRAGPRLVRCCLVAIHSPAFPQMLSGFVID